MMGTKGRNRSHGILEALRPAVIGLLLSGVVTAGLIAGFSLMFVLIESVAESAIVPLALISAAAGCFAGAFLCAAMIRKNGMVFGLIIGVLMFVIITVIGMIGSDGIFGSEAAIKLIILLVSGGAGGYIGAGYRGRRK